MSIKVAVIGECMVELSESKEGMKRHFGGDTLNTAVYLTRANSAVDVHYITALGTDMMSTSMLEAWKEDGVKTDLVQRLDNKLPGLYFIETDETGERKFHYWRNDAAARYWLHGEQAPEILKALHQFDYIYLSGISLAILSPEDRQLLLDLLADCRKAGAKIAFDNNYRPRLWESVEVAQKTYEAILAISDMAFLTLDDEFDLWGVDDEAIILKKLAQYNIEEIVIKRGSQACLIIENGVSVEVPACVVKKEDVVDTTAAGDSFSAGYLAKRLSGASAVDSAKYAHLLASTVIKYRGAIIPLTAMPEMK